MQDQTEPFLRRAGRIALSMTVGLILAVSLYFLVDSGSSSAQDQPVAQVRHDIVDSPAPSIIAAGIPSMSLVEWGTPRNYTGNGPPGIVLKVDSTANMVDWSLSAWANQTTPTGPQLCHQSTVFFSPYDFAFQGSGGQSGSGTFTSLPSTVPQRLGPDGDQCFARIGAVGIWHVHLCLEGKQGGPRGIYDAPDGRHIDSWDRCIDQDYQV